MESPHNLQKQTCVCIHIYSISSLLTNLQWTYFACEILLMITHLDFKVYLSSQTALLSKKSLSNWPNVLLSLKKICLDIHNKCFTHESNENVKYNVLT